MNPPHRKTTEVVTTSQTHPGKNKLWGPRSSRREVREAPEGSSEQDCGSHGAYWGLLHIQLSHTYTPWHLELCVQSRWTTDALRCTYDGSCWSHVGKGTLWSMRTDCLSTIERQPVMSVSCLCVPSWQNSTIQHIFRVNMWQVAFPIKCESPFWKTLNCRHLCSAFFVVLNPFRSFYLFFSVCCLRWLTALRFQLHGLARTFLLFIGLCYECIRHLLPIPLFTPGLFLFSWGL